jgi:hypothetical protein
MLQKQLVPFNFSQGQNNKIDEKNAGVGSLFRIENGFINKAFKIQKRFGRLSIKPDSISFTNGDALGVGSDLYINDQQYLTASALGTTFRVNRVGYLAESFAESEIIGWGSTTTFLPKYVGVGTKYVLRDNSAYKLNGEFYSVVEDRHWVYNGTNFIGIAKNGATARYLNNDLAIVQTVNLTGSSTPFEISVNNIGIAICSYVASISEILCEYIEHSSYSLTSATITYSNPVGVRRIGMEIRGINPRMTIIGYENATTLRTTVLDLPAFSVVSNTTATVDALFDNEVAVMSVGVVGTSFLNFTTLTAAPSGTDNKRNPSVFNQSLGNLIMPNMRICSKPVYDSTLSAYVMVVANVKNQLNANAPIQSFTYSLVATNGTDWSVLATFLTSRAPDLDIAGVIWENRNIQISGNYYYVSLPGIFRLQNAAGQAEYRDYLVRVERECKAQFVNYKNTLINSGGYSRILNSRTNRNYPLGPAQIQSVTAGTAAAGFNAGDYTAVILTRFFNLDGEYQSFVSPALTFNFGVQYSNFRLNAQASPVPTGAGVNEVQNILYLTDTNGTILYLIKLLSPLNPSGMIDEVVSFPAGGYTANAILYTTGGVLENFTPPSLKYILQRQNRMFGIDSFDSNIIWYTKKFVDGFLPEWSASLNYSIFSKYGKANALAQINDKIIVICDRGIVYFYGDGPDATGSNGAFSEPEVLAENIFFSQAEIRSVITTEFGVFFKSSKGIQLINPGLSITDIGTPVEDYNSETITGATVSPTSDEVRFTTSAGNCLVYNTEFQFWYVFTNYNAKDTAYFRGNYVYLGATTLEQEDSTLYTDVGTNYKLKIESQWFNFNPVEFFTRVKRVLFNSTGFASTALTFKWYTDFKTTPTTITYNTLTTTNDFRIVIPVQKAGSFKWSLEDSGSVGNSFDLSSATFEVGAKQGLNKLPASRSK